MQRNLARGLPEISLSQAHDQPLYIACSGPSLRETHKELAGKSNVWACNTAYDWLVDKGYSPTGIAQAPEWPVCRYFKKVRPGSKFLFASSTHPMLVDFIIKKGGEVTLWHSDCPEDWGVDFRGACTIFGGGTVGLRSLDLAWVLGYRDVHLFGMDASVSDDDMYGVDRHVGARKKDIMEFSVNGRTFRALPGYARHVEDFGRTIRPLTGLAVTLYGDGLMQWANRQEDT